MNALQLLKDDHRNMKKLLEQVEETSEGATKQRTQLLRKIRHELKQHEEIEERLLYPELRERDEAKEIALEGFEEHHAVDLIFSELEKLPVGSEEWGPKAKVMKEMIEHHIEEEESEMFPKAEKLLGKQRLEQMGKEMAKMKQSGVEKAA